MQLLLGRMHTYHCFQHLDSTEHGFRCSAESVDVYSLLPGSEGVDSPRFSAKPQRGMPEDVDKTIAFPDVEMLSVDQFRKLKEIMQ